MVNQKRSLPMPSQQPERKRGRPMGKNRVALSEKERRARNACYERERRGIEAGLTSELAQAAGLDPTLPKMVILDKAAKHIAHGCEARKNCDIADLKRINANLILQIQNAKKRLRMEFADDSDTENLLASDSESEVESSSSSDSEVENSSSSDSEVENSCISDLEEQKSSGSDLEENKEGNSTCELDLKQEDIGAARTRPYNGRKTASRVPAADSCLAGNVDIKIETTEDTPSEPFMPTELAVSNTTISYDLGDRAMKKETEEVALCESYVPPEPLLSDTAIPYDFGDRVMKKEIEEAALSESYIPPEPLLSDTAIPDDLDSIYFETNTGSLFSFSFLSEDGSLSTRPYTGRYTPAQG